MNAARLAAAAGFALILSTAVAPAAQLMPAACPARAALTKLDAPLPRLALKLSSSDPVVIVAIGSSSTAGTGASAADFSYPARLQFALRQAFPGHDIKVINRGINGQDGPEMIARFDTDVAALKPTLVIWQSGVNALFRDDGLATAGGIVREAIKRTRALGADFLMIDPQYAPRVVADADTKPMVSLLSQIAAEEKVAIFHRFALMQDWHEHDGMPFERFLWKDNFHMNDWSYDCLGRDLARSIAANIGTANRSAEVMPDTKLKAGVGTAGALPAASTSRPVALPAGAATLAN
jgi:lysophospholipase L1-like esterase